ncbi:hypothetical protein C8F01DRAFT_1306381 [Mycena amicta]|nr:hypothetical protein C8F01DRAFT_1306381 [Mycena amicta]
MSSISSPTTTRSPLTGTFAPGSPGVTSTLLSPVTPRSDFAPSYLQPPFALSDELREAESDEVGCSYTEADIILRTSDGVDFRAHKLVLALASPFFRTMFRLPQPHDSAERIPTIPIAEDCSVMHSVLRFCYPCSDPPPETMTLEHLYAVLEAMVKYQMHHVVSRARARLLDVFLASHPVAVFAICCRFEWEATARRAAKVALGLPLRRDFQVTESTVEIAEDTDTEWLRCISGEQYRELLRYHARCSLAVTGICNDLVSLLSDGDGQEQWIWLTCQSCAPHPMPSRVGYGYGNGMEKRCATVRRWFVDWLAQGSAVLRERPGMGLDAALLAPAVVSNVMNALWSCKECRELAVEHMCRFVRDVFTPRVEEELSKISLNLKL